MMPQSLFVAINITKELALFGKDPNQCQNKRGNTLARFSFCLVTWNLFSIMKVKK